MNAVLMIHLAALVFFALCFVAGMNDLAKSDAVRLDNWCRKAAGGEPILKADRWGSVLSVLVFGLFALAFLWCVLR